MKKMERKKKTKKKEKKPNPLICESHNFTIETHSFYLTKQNLNVKKGPIQRFNLLQIAPWEFGPQTAI
jgi:hypothetical protein